MRVLDRGGWPRAVRHSREPYARLADNGARLCVMPSQGSPQDVYYVVEMTVAFTSLAHVQQQAPAALADHLARSRALHDEGAVLMAGAFLEPEPDDEHMRTMAICVSRDAAERFVAGDPFVRSGHVPAHRIRPWANMFAR